MEPLTIRYHRHQPGGYVQFDMVRGEARAKLCPFWILGDGLAYAERLAAVLGDVAVIEEDPCDACLAHAAEVAARAAGRPAPPPRRPTSLAPAPNPKPFDGRPERAPATPAAAAGAEDAPV